MSRKKHVESDLEMQYGDLHMVIPKLVSLHGQEEAARLLGRKQAWVSRWLKANGYIARTVYEKTLEKETTS